MKQEPKAQIPGIDLTFPDGRKGRIWGISGIDDLRGASFEKASIYLRDRAEQEGAFDWTIILELDQVISSAFRSLLGMITVLEHLVAKQPDRRSVTIEWLVKPGDGSMRSMANDMKKQLQEKGRKGLTIHIKDREPTKLRRR
jgi:hypothetical protein